MAKTFVYFLAFIFLEIVANIFSNYVFADYEDEQEENEEETSSSEETSQEESNEDEDIKTSVHSIVDSLLKTNNHAELSTKDPKIQKLMKEQNIGKQIERLRVDISSLQKTLENHYNDVSDKSEKKKRRKDEKNDEDEEQNDEKNKTAKRRHISSHNRHRKHHSSRRGEAAYRKIYTVKNVDPSKIFTNKYLLKQQSSRNYKSKFYNGNNSASFGYTPTYKIKSYGTTDSEGNVQVTDDSLLSNKKFTIKPGQNYLKTQDCSQPKGCG
jgi:hypothetical protein